jgi:hypothetical protein
MNWCHFDKRKSKATSFAALLGCFSGLLAQIPPLWAYLCHQSLAHKVNIGQRQGSERAGCVLVQTSVTHLAKSPPPLDHAKDVFHLSTDF